MELIRQFSQGKLPLWKAFWIFGVIGNFFIAFIFSLATHKLAENIIFIQAIAAVGFGISVFIWVGQWRCAYNTGRLFLGGLLRTWLIVSALAAIGNILPHLPEAVRTAVGGVFTLGILAVIAYYVLAPFRDFVRLQIFKRRNPEK